MRMYAYTSDDNLLGAIGVYVDASLFVESADGGWQSLMKQTKALYSMGQP